MTHVERLRKMAAMWRDIPKSVEARLELANLFVGYAIQYPEGLAEILSMPVDAVSEWVVRTCSEAVTSVPEPKGLDLDELIVLRGATTLADAIEGIAALRVWNTGDAVMVEFEGRTLRASVLLASHNGRSLALQFDGLVGGYAGMMPAMWNDARRTFVDIMELRPVVVRAVEVSDD